MCRSQKVSFENRIRPAKFSLKIASYSKDNKVKLNLQEMHRKSGKLFKFHRRIGGWFMLLSFSLHNGYLELSGEFQNSYYLGQLYTSVFGSIKKIFLTGGPTSCKDNASYKEVLFRNECIYRIFLQGLWFSYFAIKQKQ